jgi:orotate phosphoribosyltransferase
MENTQRATAVISGVVVVVDRNSGDEEKKKNSFGITP